MKVIKKPPTFVALQFTGQNAAEFQNMFDVWGEVVTPFDCTPYLRLYNPDASVQGDLRLSVNAWLVRGEGGHLSVLGPQAFTEQYSEVK